MTNKQVLDSLQDCHVSLGGLGVLQLCQQRWLDLASHRDVAFEDRITSFARITCVCGSCSRSQECFRRTWSRQSASGTNPGSGSFLHLAIDPAAKSGQTKHSTCK